MKKNLRFLANTHNLVGVIALAWASQMAACGAYDEATRRLELLSEREFECVADIQCCVAIRPCDGAAFVIAIDDFDQAAALVEIQNSALNGGPAECSECTLPSIDVRCVEGRCVGTEATVFVIDDGKGGFTNFSQTSHCNALPETRPDDDPNIVDISGNGTQFICEGP